MQTLLDVFREGSQLPPYADMHARTVANVRTRAHTYTHANIDSVMGPYMSPVLARQGRTHVSKVVAHAQTIQKPMKFLTTG